MASRNRTVKIWTILVASMTAGAAVLMVLDNHKISAGAFSLSSFQQLGSVEHAIGTENRNINTQKWNSISIFFSNTAGGNVENIALAQGLVNSDEADFHFLVGNGDGALDGHIIPSQRWKNQLRCIDKSIAIKICIVADGTKTLPTDTQIKRTSALIDRLAKMHKIKSTNISYPASLQF